MERLVLRRKYSCFPPCRSCLDRRTVVAYSDHRLHRYVLVCRCTDASVHGNHTPVELPTTTYLTYLLRPHEVCRLTHIYCTQTGELSKAPYVGYTYTWVTELTVMTGDLLSSNHVLCQIQLHEGTGQPSRDLAFDAATDVSRLLSLARLQCSDTIYRETT